MCKAVYVQLNALVPLLHVYGHLLWQSSGSTYDLGVTSTPMGIRSREPGTARGTARRPHFSRAFISVTVQLWT